MDFNTSIDTIKEYSVVYYQGVVNKQDVLSVQQKLNDTVTVVIAVSLYFFVSTQVRKLRARASASAPTGVRCNLI